jgi:hypothetical protein
MSFPLSGDKNFLNWLANNYQKTSFKTFAEAKSCYEDMEATSAIVRKENQALYDLMERATPDQNKKILQPFFDYVKKAHEN